MHYFSTERYGKFLSNRFVMQWRYTDVIIIIIIRKFITHTCSQAISMNRRRGQSLGGLTVCINC